MSWAVRQVWFSSLNYLGPKTISNIRVQKGAPEGWSGGQTPVTDCHQWAA